MKFEGEILQLGKKELKSLHCARALFVWHVQLKLSVKALKKHLPGIERLLIIILPSRSSKKGMLLERRLNEKYVTIRYCDKFFTDVTTSCDFTSVRL